MSKIEWTDTTWNPVTGCTKIATGCLNCFAQRMAHRLKRMGQTKYVYADPFAVRWHPDVLDQPRKWKKPRMVFVCSMGDLFHTDVPDRIIKRIFATMAWTPQHTYQVLTKRPRTMAAVVPRIYNAWSEERWHRRGGVLKNLWLGTSVSTQADADANIPPLLNTPAALRFLSAEPLLENIDLRVAPCRACNHPGNVLEWPCPHCSGRRFRWPDWVIVGAESGPNARPCNLDWVRSLRDQCLAAGIPLFVKQIHVDGKLVKDIEQFPKDLRIRQWPEKGGE